MDLATQLGRLTALPAEKRAAPRWLQMIQQGLLSPQGIKRVTSALPEGSFRFVKNLGRGAANVADQVAGNVAGHAGEMVRKIPLKQVPDTGGLTNWYKPVVEESARMESVMPGVSAPYIAATPRGAFQHLADKNVYPQPSWWDRLLGKITRATPQELQTSTNISYQEHVADKLRQHGFADFHTGNFGPGGQVLDFSSMRRSEPAVNAFPRWAPPVADPQTPNFLDRVRHYYSI